MSLEDLKNRIKDQMLSDILGRYIDVVQKGATKKARCPFHDDHDPSLHIDDNKGRWHCFVDNIGGDAISFVMKFKNTDFKGALQDICEHLGWHFQDYERKKKQSPREEMARRILSRCQALYARQAMNKKNNIFHDFVAQRGLKPEIVEDFQLGFAGANGELFNYLQTIKNDKERELAINIAEQIGLIKSSKYQGASHYDKFRERIIFPIWDHYGLVVGFTSRAIRDKQLPKYMNSEDSFIFNKGQILYGLHLAKPYIKEKNQVILVEGNMDAIALHQYGFNQSVAIMGVACSPHSIKKLTELTKNIYLCLDNDGAGHKAQEKINRDFLHHGIVPRYINLGPHKDPDEFLKHLGALEFKDRLERATTYLDELIERLIPTKIPELTERKFEILELAFSLCAPLQKSLGATERVVAFAKRLGLASDSKQIIQSYEDFLSKGKKTIAQAITPAISSPPPLTTSEAIERVETPSISRESSLPLVITAAEKILLQQLIQHPELLTHGKITELLDYVECYEVKRYICKMKEFYYEIDEKEFPSLVADVLGGDDYPLDIKLIAGGALNNYTPQTLNQIVMNKIVNDLDKKLKLASLATKRLELRKMISSMTTEEEANELLNKLKMIDTEIMKVKKRKPNIDNSIGNKIKEN